MKYCRTLGAEAAICEGYTKGGDGMTEMADEDRRRGEPRPTPQRVKPIYKNDQSLIDEDHDGRDARSTARRGWRSSRRRNRASQKFEALGYGKLPVCIAKTQYSFTDDPKQMGAPVGWTLTISDVTLSAGAGFVVAIAGSMMLMPGLGKVPQAQKLDVDDQGRAIGMDY